MSKLVNVLKPINAPTETAFQRAILKNGESFLGGRTKIEWLDIELPVDDGRGPRRQCVDLIGKQGENYVLCELKFGKDSGTDSPEYAAAEVRKYHEKIKLNWVELDKKFLHHPDGKPFLWKNLARESTALIVAANASYWAYWLGHRKADLSKIEGVQFYSVDVPADTFTKQKANLETYIPTIDTNHWDIL